MLLKSPDLLQFPSEPATNGAPKGQGRFAAHLVRAGPGCAQCLREEPRRHASADGGEEQRALGWLRRAGGFEEHVLPILQEQRRCGAGSPFSDFFYVVLSHYKPQALHMHPNSVLLLSIFAFYCEAYVG